MSLKSDLEVLGLNVSAIQGGDLSVHSPIDGVEIGRIHMDKSRNVSPARPPSSSR